MKKRTLPQKPAGRFLFAMRCCEGIFLFHCPAVVLAICICYNEATYAQEVKECLRCRI